MSAPFNPEVEKALLYAALTNLINSGGQEACAALCTALERAQRALLVLDQQHDEGPAWRVHRAGLSILIAWAEAEVERAERMVRPASGQRLMQEDAIMPALDAVVPASTIIACPDCGEGLYKTSRRATTEDIVCDDGSLVVPLNTAIPFHHGTPGNRWRVLRVEEGYSRTARFTPCSEGGSDEPCAYYWHRLPACHLSLCRAGRE